MLELVTCDFTWERNNDYKGRARLAYPLSPEWNWKLVFIEFRIRLSELIKTKTKLLFCCEPVEHSVPLHQLSHSGLVLLLLELLQSLMDTLTEEPEMKSVECQCQYSVKQRRDGEGGNYKNLAWWNIACLGTRVLVGLPGRWYRSHSEIETENQFSCSGYAKY